MPQTRSMQTATQVLDAHWDGTLPVNPVKIAAAIGVLVRNNDSMPESGIIELTDSGPVITYNGSEIAERKRFTIAHEIGHFVLGHLKPGSPKFREYRDLSSNFSSRSANPQEREANTFAAQLLMPAKTVKFVVAEKKITDVDELAKVFGVSQVAMKYRLSNIGLIHA